MPRISLDISDQVDILSILDENGMLDEKLEPQITNKKLLEIHFAMLLGRRFDERMLNLQRQGRIGTFAPIKGQEAAHVGPVVHLKPEDWLVPSFREQAALIWRGVPLSATLLGFGGFYQGNAIEIGGRTLPNAVPVGTQLPHAVGIAYANKFKKEPSIVMVFFGDGATSQGEFHEALNFSAVLKLPVVFICQNNQYAISMPRKQQTHSQTIAQKAIAYGMPGIQVDGNDVLASYAASKEAVERARSGEGPTLIECETYRLSLHTTADDPKKYRSEAEEQEWAQRDPIPRFQGYLKNKGVLSDEMLSEIDEQIADRIQEAVDEAEAQMINFKGDALTLFDHMYSEPTPQIIEQRSELEHALEATRREQVTKNG